MEGQLTIPEDLKDKAGVEATRRYQETNKATSLTNANWTKAVFDTEAEKSALIEGGIWIAPTKVDKKKRGVIEILQGRDYLGQDAAGNIFMDLFTVPYQEKTQNLKDMDGAGLEDAIHVVKELSNAGVDLAQVRKAIKEGLIKLKGSQSLDSQADAIVLDVGQKMHALWSEHSIANAGAAGVDSYTQGMIDTSFAKLEGWLQELDINFVDIILDELANRGLIRAGFGAVAGNLLAAEIIRNRESKVMLRGEKSREEILSEEFLNQFELVIPATSFSGKEPGVRNNAAVEATLEREIEKLMKERGVTDTRKVLVIGGGTDFGGIHSLYNVAERLGLQTMGLFASVGLSSTDTAGNVRIRANDHYYVHEGDWGSESPTFVELAKRAGQRAALITFGGGGQAMAETKSMAEAGIEVVLIKGVHELDARDRESAADKLSKDTEFMQGHKNVRSVERAGFGQETAAVKLQEASGDVPDQVQRLTQRIEEASAAGQENLASELVAERLELAVKYAWDTIRNPFIAFVVEKYVRHTNVTDLQQNILRGGQSLRAEIARIMSVSKFARQSLAIAWTESPDRRLIHNADEAKSMERDVLMLHSAFYSDDERALHSKYDRYWGSQQKKVIERKEREAWQQHQEIKPILSQAQKLEPALELLLMYISDQANLSRQERKISRRVKSEKSALGKIAKFRAHPEWGDWARNATVADLFDILGGRIVVDDLDALERLMRAIDSQFGFEIRYDSGNLPYLPTSSKVLTKENKFLVNQEKDDPYRAIQYTVRFPERSELKELIKKAGIHLKIPDEKLNAILTAIDAVDDTTLHTFELQIKTERGSTASDMWHDVGFKDLLGLVPELRQIVNDYNWSSLYEDIAIFAEKRGLIKQEDRETGAIEKASSAFTQHQAIPDAERQKYESAIAESILTGDENRFYDLVLSHYSSDDILPKEVRDLIRLFFNRQLQKLTAYKKQNPQAVAPLEEAAHRGYMKSAVLDELKPDGPQLGWRLTPEAELLLPAEGRLAYKGRFENFQKGNKLSVEDLKLHQLTAEELETFFNASGKQFDREKVRRIIQQITERGLAETEIVENLKLHQLTEEELETFFNTSGKQFDRERVRHIIQQIAERGSTESQIENLLKAGQATGIEGLIVRITFYKTDSPEHQIKRHSLKIMNLFHGSQIEQIQAANLISDPVVRQAWLDRLDTNQLGTVTSSSILTEIIHGPVQDVDRKPVMITDSVTGETRPLMRDLSELVAVGELGETFTRREMLIFWIFISAINPKGEFADRSYRDFVTSTSPDDKWAKKIDGAMDREVLITLVSEQLEFLRNRIVQNGTNPVYVARDLDLRRELTEKYVRSVLHDQILVRLLTEYFHHKYDQLVFNLVRNGKDTTQAQEAIVNLADRAIVERESANSRLISLLRERIGAGTQQEVIDMLSPVFHSLDLADEDARQIGEFLSSSAALSWSRDPKDYFISSNNSEVLPLEALEQEHLRREAVVRAKSYMWFTMRGQSAKRKPIEIAPIVEHDGTVSKYLVLDGNTSVEVAKEIGLATLIAIKKNPITRADVESNKALSGQGFGTQVDADISIVFEAARRLLEPVQVQKIENAINLAREIHAGQTRAAGDPRPYLAHIAAVPKKLILNYGVSYAFQDTEKVSDAIAAAFLHDAVEDATKGELGQSLSRQQPEDEVRQIVTDRIRNEVGEEVASIVLELSKPILSKTAPSPEEAEASYIANLLAASLAAQLIKLADWHANFDDLVNVPASNREWTAEFVENRLDAILNFLRASQVDRSLKLRLLNQILEAGRVNNELNKTIPGAENITTLTEDQERKIQSAKSEIARAGFGTETADSDKRIQIATEVIKAVQPFTTNQRFYREKPAGTYLEEGMFRTHKGPVYEPVDPGLNAQFEGRDHLSKALDKLQPRVNINDRSAILDIVRVNLEVIARHGGSPKDDNDASIDYQVSFSLSDEPGTAGFGAAEENQPEPGPASNLDDIFARYGHLFDKYADLRAKPDFLDEIFPTDLEAKFGGIIPQGGFVAPMPDFSELIRTMDLSEMKYLAVEPTPLELELDWFLEKWKQPFLAPPLTFDFQAFPKFELMRGLQAGLLMMRIEEALAGEAGIKGMARRAAFQVARAGIGLIASIDDQRMEYERADTIRLRGAELLAKWFGVDAKASGEAGFGAVEGTDYRTRHGMEDASDELRKTIEERRGVSEEGRKLDGRTEPGTAGFGFAPVAAKGNVLEQFAAEFGLAQVSKMLTEAIRKAQERGIGSDKHTILADPRTVLSYDETVRKTVFPNADKLLIAGFGALSKELKESVANKAASIFGAGAFDPVKNDQNIRDLDQQDGKLAVTIHPGEALKESVKHQIDSIIDADTRVYVRSQSRLGDFVKLVEAMFARQKIVAAMA